jgi:riboflavin kinase / FMN adenylyltransferase
MNIIAEPSDLRAGGRKVCVAIGMFDGVHLGHQQVIHQMIADARAHEALAVVATFDQHPNTVVAPDRAPALIYPLEKRLRVIGELGADATWLIRFDAAFSRIAGEEFVRRMVRGFGRVHSLCVGGDFAFGHKRSGNVALLRALGTELDYSVHGLAAVSLDGEAVSSTRIRERLRGGDFDGATQMLGRAYSLCGRVQRGDQVGRTLGFPTANLDVRGLVLPPPGVYAVHVEWKGKSLRGALNLGLRPTLAQPQPTLQTEVHLLDFTGEIYDEELEVVFVRRLRNEQKFASREALREQIGRDIAAARHEFE